MNPPAAGANSPLPETPLREREAGLEKLTLNHVLGLCIGAAWAFGGNADWSRNLVAAWGSLGLPLFLLLVRQHRRQRQVLPRALLGLWPLLVLNLLVVFSLFFPGLNRVYYLGEPLFVQNFRPPLLPSSARPLLSLHALWVFDAIYLSCFNLMLGIKRRRIFRRLLLVLSVNALVLAVFGTLQKLLGAKGLFFGLQPSPQVKFFASFIYHNHWGAFIILMVAGGLGLLFHFLRRCSREELPHTPAPLVVVAVSLEAISIPLSGSRSTSVLMLLLLTVALCHWTVFVFKRSRSSPAGKLRLSLGAVLAFAALGAAGYKLAEPVIHLRWSETRQQIAALKSPDTFGSRTVLYRDTWHMARDRWLFGWGMGSYPTVFYLYNTQQESPVDHLPMYFHDAHSDWLQSLAELGFAGTLLLGLAGLLPLWMFRRQLGSSPVSRYLLGGCALMLLYAWLEFPFGNTAVVIAFWLSFFTALQYGRAESDPQT
jgi:O-antigen ligase